MVCAAWATNFEYAGESVGKTVHFGFASNGYCCETIKAQH